MFSKRVESTVGKGEIARYEQFLLFTQCFQRPVLQTCKNKGLFGNGLSSTCTIVNYLNMNKYFIHVVESIWCVISKNDNQFA